MQFLRLKFWLLQLNAQSINFNLKLCCSKQKVLCRGFHFKVDPEVIALRNKLLYCDYLDLKSAKLTYKQYKLTKPKEAAKNTINSWKQVNEPVRSIFVDKKVDTSVDDQEKDHAKPNTQCQKPIYMPYSKTDSYETINEAPHDIGEDASILLNKKYKNWYEKCLKIKTNLFKSEDQFSFEDYTKSNLLPKGELWKVPPTWMCDFEEFDDTLLDVDVSKIYGTPDPVSEVSSVPCGGCGALLHCKDPAIPGYLPSELFLQKDIEDLKLITCQRCHFLKFYNASLEVKVSIEDYPKLLSIIKRKKCAIILIIDLTDFPCSIWPDLKSIMHPFTPIFLVGNKVDLLPRDSPYFFNNVIKQLVDTVLQVTGIKRENITYASLTSAKTGFGIEELINKLQYKWRNKGDVYLVGCTNVGKSSMFNTLLNSDYCRVQAIDLVQRATISPWPGTTLNLLKFPTLYPSGRKLVSRLQRLQAEQFYKISNMKYRNDQFKESRKMIFATLQDSVGRTFTANSINQKNADPFSELPYKSMLRKQTFDESRSEYKQSCWCYDTPGTIQQDQILDLLTTDELLATLPQEIITPRTFILKVKETVFVAGIGRLDFLEGDLYIRCTLFTSQKLPITMCYTADAEDVYNRLLRTEAFVVPTNDPKRLELWPKLKSQEIKVTGVDRNESVADVVLSSIGWIAVTPHANEKVTLRAWTPQGRGIYLRTPALLKKSVALRGNKIQGTPLYSLGHKVYVK